MPTSFTTNLRLSNPGLGDTGWGSTVSNGMIDLVDPAISGTTSVSVTAGNVTLTSLNGVADQARQMFLVATGTPGVPRDVIVPSTSKLYFVKNDANDTVTFKVLGQPGVAVPAGSAMALRVNGTDVVVAQDQFVTLKASGTTTLAALTATGDVTFDGGAFVFNESGADKDARFEGDTDANLLFLDASTDRVGVGTSTPAAKLDVNGSAAITGNVTLTGDVVLANDQYLYWGVGDGSAYVRGNSSSDYVSFGTVGLERMLLDSSGNVGIGTASAASIAKLAVSNTGTADNNRLGVSASNYLSLPSFTASFLGQGDISASGTQCGLNNASLGYLLFQNTTAGLIYTNGGVPLVFGTSGNERMRIDSSGNLGIGTSSPDAKLTVNGVAAVGDGAVGAPSLANTGDLNTGLWFPAADTVAISTGGTEACRVDPSGNLGLGGAPSAWNIVGVGRVLELGGGAVFTNSANTECSIAQNAYNNSGWKYKYTGVSAGMATNINGTHAWYAAPSGTAGNAIFFTEVMALDASGNLSCGGVYTNTTGSAANVFVSNTGLLQRSTSSLKYKTDIQDAAHGLADVMRLRPVTYKSKTDGDRVFGGLIAEEVHSAGLTEFVQYADDGSPDALAYGNMVALLIKAIQEQQAVINELRARVAALEAK